LATLLVALARSNSKSVAFGRDGSCSPPVAFQVFYSLKTINHQLAGLLCLEFDFPYAGEAVFVLAN